MESINLRSPVLFQLFKYIVVAILSIFIWNWFGGCSSESTKGDIQKVIVTEKSGTFEAKKPEYVPFKINQEQIYQKGKTVYKANPVDEKLTQENEKLKQDYALATDSLKSIKYDKAIQLNKFSTNFEDEYLKLTINGMVRGEVQEITPEYTIKPREIEIKQKQTVFRLLAGAETGTSIITPKLNFKANLMLQNRNGDIISASYDTNKNVWIGFNKSIFNIKR